MLLTKLISLPISILLFLWMLRIKKKDPFPKGSVVKMIIAGALTTFGTTILTVLLGVIALAHRLGPDAIATILSDPNSEATAGIVAQLNELAGEPDLFSVFVGSFITAAAVEELLKYLAMRLCLRKSGVMKTRMDALVCGDESTDAEMTAVGTSFEFNIGKKLTAEFLASGNTATALVGANDMIAFGIISQLRSSGLRVPKDYSVCGFDNVFTSSMVTPGLTSIDHRLMARCRTAIQMIIQQDNLEDSMAEKIEYTPQLVARNSTAAPIAGKSGNGACDS